MWRKGLIFLMVVFFGLTVLAEERTGAWVDEVTFQEQTDKSKAIEMMKAGEGDLYAYDITEPELVEVIKAAEELKYVQAYGLFYELTFNPVLKFNDGRLNPFGDPKIREAMNWLVDREYLCDEIFKGIAIPKYFVITPTFPDYGRYIDVARALEAKYAHTPENVEKAKKIIADEMKALGAELVDGKWAYDGKPIEIIFLIRTEDARKQIGDYVANILEDLGFTVKRKYGISRDLAALWIGTDPAEGQWHIYTGGWLYESIVRDEGSAFSDFYTPRGWSIPLWQAYKPSKEFDEVAEKLLNRAYSTMEERRKLFAKALELSMKDSVRVWLVLTKSLFVMRKDIAAAYDLSSGTYGCQFWAHAIRRIDPETGEIKPGGSVKILVGAFLNEPWNPIGGSDWIYDAMPFMAAGDRACMPNPYTGLPLPNRVKKAEVYVVKGLPVTKTYDWVDLEFVDEIKVPADAYIDWDAENQRWITVGEKYPEGLTAKTETIVYFADDMFKMKWHDGSTMSPADVFLDMIMTFDLANEKSPIYDEAAVPGFQAFKEVFKGFKIVSLDPLVVEFYSDRFYLDAEDIAADAANSFDAFYSQGPAPWHGVAIGILAEAARKLAFSSDKANKLGVGWMNYVAGPSLKILAEELDKAIQEKFIPYANAFKQMGIEISLEEAVARYNALKAWYEAKGHFWVGNGPLALDKVDTTAKILVFKRFPDFPDPADKWLKFAEPKLATVELVGQPVVKIGTGAVVAVNITFKEEPYPPEEIESVKYLVFDSEGNLLLKGDAEYFSGSTWNIVLKPDDTAKFPEGAIKVEVVVVSKMVAIPVIKDIQFVAVR